MVLGMNERQGSSPHEPRNLRGAGTRVKEAMKGQKCDKGESPVIPRGDQGWLP